MMHGVNIHYSQSPIQGQAIANSKVKVNIHGHQKTAIHALLTCFHASYPSTQSADSFSVTQCRISTFKWLFCKI